MPTYAKLLKDFREFDFNGDGEISADEFLAILQRDGENGELDEKTAQFMLDKIAKHDGGKLDKDGDGKISVEELAAALADEEEPSEKAPVLVEMVRVFRLEYKLSKELAMASVVQTVAERLDLSAEEKSLPLHELSVKVWHKYKAAKAAA